jgi:hypothetical protein
MDLCSTSLGYLGLEAEIASGLRRFAPSLYRAGRWAYGTPSNILLASRETGTTYSLSSAQGVRQGDPLGPLMFSLGIWALLADLSTTLGPHRLILAYLDDIYILSNDPNALEDGQAFFSARQPPIQLNMAKSKRMTLQKARETGLQLLGSCIVPTAARERFLEAKVVAEETLLAKLVDLPHQHALLVLRQCLQQNLRHLQRSLHSDDLEHLWERLDTSLANSVRRVRTAGSPAPSQAIDDTLIALPIKLGGLGILSCKITKLVQKHLNAVAREKRRRALPSDRPFTPFVLSFGGTMETDARDALKLWKSIMTEGVYSLLIRRLSLGLLRTRAR